MADQNQDSGSHPFHREGSDIIFDSPAKQKEDAEEIRRREQHEFQRAQVKSNKIIVWFTGALMLATFCTIGVGMWQGFNSQKAANAAQDSAKAAKRSACVAVQTLLETQRNNLGQTLNNQRTTGIMVNSLQLDQRAWVAVREISGTPEIGKDFAVQIRAGNTGRTFAKRFKMVSNLYIGPPAHRPDFSKPSKRNVVSSVSLVPPGGDYLSTTQATGLGSKWGLPNFQESDLDLVRTGKFEVIAYGRMDYIDVFKRRHWTTYCFEIQPSLKWEACREYNDADNVGSKLQPAIQQLPQPTIPADSSVCKDE